MASRIKPISRSSVRHPSHNHPLRAFKSQEGDEYICSGCELELTGQAFKCTKSECDYFLHKSCFDLPSETHHKSHPDHPLTLHHSPPCGLSTYTCDACGDYGSGFAYHCSECKYNVHVGCAFIPETVEREDHEHPLTLFYNTPFKGREDGKVFTCDVCKENISENLWVYYCEECDYGTHVYSCTVYEEEQEEEEGEAMEAERQMFMNKLTLQALDNGLSYLDSPGTKYYYL